MHWVATYSEDWARDLLLLISTSCSWRAFPSHCFMDGFFVLYILAHNWPSGSGLFQLSGHYHVTPCGGFKTCLQIPWHSFHPDIGPQFPLLESGPTLKTIKTSKTHQKWLHKSRNLWGKVIKGDSFHIACWEFAFRVLSQWAWKPATLRVPSWEGPQVT